MCLTIKTDITSKKGIDDLKPEIATKSIYIWKRFRKNRKKQLRSPHREFRYEFNARYAVENCLEIVSYRDYYGSSAQKPVYRGLIYNGLHAYSDAKRAKDQKCAGEIIIKCRIPRGAKYFCGQKGEIVANKMALPNQDKEFARHPKRITLSS